MTDEPFAVELCPVCGAAQARAWRYCPFCGQFMEPQETLTWDGDLLVVPKGTRLTAPYCLFCAGREHVRAWDKEFSNAPAWLTILCLVLALTVCIGFIVPFIIYTAIRKAHRLALPRCDPCRDRMNTAMMGACVSAGAAFILLPLGMGFGAYVATGREDLGLLAGVGGLMAACVVTWLVQRQWVLRRCVTVKRIGEAVAALRVPDPAATRAALAGMRESTPERAP